MDKDEGTDYQPATIGDALRDAFVEAEASETPNEPDDAAEAEPEEVEAAADDAGEQSGEPEQGESDDVKTGIEPPEHWPDADKEVFLNATPELQEWALKRDKDRDRMITEKTTEIAEQRKRYEALDKILEPYLPMINGQEATVIGNSLQLQAFLSNQTVSTEKKIEALQNAVRPFGLDLSKHLSQDDDVYEEQDQLGEIRSDVQSLRQERQQEQMLAESQRRIDAFRSETDESGALLRPHFEKVENVMAKFVAGGVKDLDEAYKLAVRADDELHNQTLEAERKKAREKAQAELGEKKRKKAEQAKKAASKVVSSGSGNAERGQPDRKKSIREELADAWAEQQVS